MEIFQSLDSLPSHAKQAVIAVGNFDGCIAGIKRSLQQAKNIADQHDKPFGVLTFEPHPKSFFNPMSRPLVDSRLFKNETS